MSFTQTAYVDDETGRAHAITEPARPDLKPGETVTYAPDRYCLACEQARGTRRCPVCGGATLTEAEVAAAAAVPVHFDRPMGVLPPVDLLADDADDDDMEPLELGGGPALELVGRPDDAIELAPGELGAPELAPAPHRARYVERRDVDDVRPQRGRVQPDGHADNNRGRAVSAHNARPVPQRFEKPIPPRRKRVVEVAPNAARRASQGAAAMERSNTTSARRPQRIQEVDEDGRDVHRTGSARRGRSVEDMYNILWDEAKVDKTMWARFAAAALMSPVYDEDGKAFERTPTDAASVADAMYCELIDREKKS